MEKPCCRTCPYWAGSERNINDLDKDECRRYPPDIGGRHLPPDHDAPIGQDAFPCTTGGMFCGEHPDFPAWLREQHAPVHRINVIGLSKRAKKALHELGRSNGNITGLRWDDIFTVKGCGG